MSSTSPRNFSGKVWLITSATSPLGFSIARQALKNGDRVVAGCSIEEHAIWRDSMVATQDGNATTNNKSKLKTETDVIQSLDVGILQKLGRSSCLVVALD